MYAITFRVGVKRRASSSQFATTEVGTSSEVSDCVPNARFDGPRVPIGQYGTWPVARIGGLFFLFSERRLRIG